jgi:hypothetical protein
MLQELLTLLPTYSGTLAITIASVSAICGAGLWLLGARFSRHLISLLLTTVGAGIGLEMPRILNWNISGAGVAVGGAVLLGVMGFLMHRFWIGLMFGVVMAFWVSLICWTLMNHDQPMTWPQVNEQTTLVTYSTDLWQSLPADVTRVVPFASGIAVVSGICAVLLWPRMATALAWSLLGATLLVGMGIFAMTIRRPQWMSTLPAQTWSQVVVFTGLILFGAVVQFSIAPRAVRRPAPAAAPEPTEK